MKTFLKKYMNLSSLYKNRFIIAFCILIFCLAFNIHGSSINQWNAILDTGIPVNQDLIFGKPRNVRSDEWMLFTPMMFSQFFNNFNYFSQLIRGTSTDVFMIYGLPVLNIMQIFRPFQLSFILMGLEKGLSFFWVARFLCLFLINIDFFMLLTKKNKLLSFIRFYFNNFLSSNSVVVCCKWNSRIIYFWRIGFNFTL